LSVRIIISYRQIYKVKKLIFINLFIIQTNINMETYISSSVDIQLKSVELQNKQLQDDVLKLNTLNINTITKQDVANCYYANKLSSGPKVWEKCCTLFTSSHRRFDSPTFAICSIDFQFCVKTLGVQQILNDFLSNI
jgi:nitrous oxidase accessory protein NosD